MRSTTLLPPFLTPFLSRLKRILKTRIDGFVFFLRFPYLRRVEVMGLGRMRLPFILSAGKGSRLLVENSAHDTALTIEGKTWIGRDVEFSVSGTDQIIVKAGTTIQDRCKIQGSVTLERDVILAPNVFISSGTHEAFRWPELNIRAQDARLEKPSSLACHIEEDVWIGTGVFVKAGTYIGRGAVIGANSVVLKDVSPYSVVAGIPAKPIRNRLEFKPPRDLSPEQASLPYLYRGIGRGDMALSPESMLVVALAKIQDVEFDFTNYSESEIKIEITTNQGETAQLDCARGSNAIRATRGGPREKSEVKFPEALEHYLAIHLSVPDGAKVVFKRARILPNPTEGVQ